jgi:hypothetical protein
MNLVVLLPSVAAGVMVAVCGADRRREARKRALRCLPRVVRVDRRALHGNWGARLRAWTAVSSPWAVPALVALGTAAVIGGPAGLPVGAAVAVVARRCLPKVRSPVARQAARDEDLLARQLPLAADLLAACLGSCSSPAQAATAVAGSVEPPMSGWLAALAAQLALGAPPEACWEQLGTECPRLAPLARCLARTSTGGTPPTAALNGLAQAQRAAAGRAAHARVRRAGVLATAPLGLCFLPAFVLVGIAPVVMSLTALFARHV